jgi:hypothetical protein
VLAEPDEDRDDESQYRDDARGNRKGAIGHVLCEANDYQPFSCLKLQHETRANLL